MVCRSGWSVQRRRCMVLHCILFLTLSGVSGDAGRLLAAQRPDGKLTLPRAVAQLGSDQWRVRSRAQAWLLLQSPRNIKRLMPLLKKSANPETRTRLIRICLQYVLSGMELLSGPRPLLGIEFFPRHLTLRHGKKTFRLNAAQVVSTVPGLPAARVLHSGDLIIAINSQPLPGEQDVGSLPQMLAAFKPMEAVNLLVVGREKMRIDSIRLVGAPKSDIQMFQIMQEWNVTAAAFVKKYDRKYGRIVLGDIRR